MKHPRATIATIGLSVAAIAGGVTVVATAGGSTPNPPPAVAAAAANPSATPTPAPAAPAPGAATSTAPATVQTASATVAGAAETILVDARGFPLYFYDPDTATKSMVSGELAFLWPPLVANAPIAGNGVTGALKVVSTSNGHQVTYKGHFLYTFRQDSPGVVTGQGVQNFYVATPGMPVLPAAPAAAPAPSRLRPRPRPAIAATAATEAGVVRNRSSAHVPHHLRQDSASTAAICLGRGTGGQPRVGRPGSESGATGHPAVIYRMMSELSPVGRAEVIRNLEQWAAAESRPRRRRASHRWVVRFLALSCLALIPWTIGLAVTLPRSYLVGNWPLAWTGFDIILLGCLSTTAWSLWKQRQVAVPASMITSVLLLCDAWFDILTAHGGRCLAVSIATAIGGELPIAFLLGSISVRLLRANVREARDVASNAGPHSLWRTSLVTSAVPAIPPGITRGGRGGSSTTAPPGGGLTATSRPE